MTVSAAYALNPNLITKPRDSSREQAALKRLAAWGLQFTAKLNIVPPQALLLEIANSETYFGGRQKLLAQIKTGLGQLGYQTHYAVAPTPLAALWLAANNTKCIVTDKTTLGQQLSHLTLSSLDLPVALLNKLQKTGLHTVGNCLGLPRAEFSRRFGQSLQRNFDRALGKLADPQPCYKPPDRFHASLDFPSEIENTDALLLPLQRLLLELTGFLQARQQGIQALHLSLHHDRHPESRLTLQTVAVSRDPDQWLHLLQTRLENIKLPQAVNGIQLRSDKMQTLPAKPKRLFAEPGEIQNELWQQLLNRLHARMGPHAVYGVKSAADHRPEKSWCYCTPGEQGLALKTERRPLWLLKAPKRLSQIGCKLYWQGELQLCQGPERIESGWWDNQGIQRDYFIARNQNGTRVWIFHTHGKTKQWYLHGIFS